MQRSSTGGALVHLLEQNINKVSQASPDGVNLLILKMVSNWLKTIRLGMRIRRAACQVARVLGLKARLVHRRLECGSPREVAPQPGSEAWVAW